jgi:hypothetical protein
LQINDICYPNIVFGNTFRHNRDTPYTIFTANSPQGIGTRLDEILKSILSDKIPTSIPPKTFVFVDVDNTLIGDGTDLYSFRKTGTFQQMIPNTPLIEKLRNLPHFVQSFALTSMGVWHTTDAGDFSIRMEADYISPPNGKEVTRSKIRSDAMQSLGLPFGGTFGHPPRQLPPVTEAVSLSDEIVAALRPVSLSDEIVAALQSVSFSTELERDFLSDFTILHHIHRPPFGRMQCDLYFQSLSNRGVYERITALPRYKDGVIFANVFDTNKGQQKGLIVHSFLQIVTERPKTIIAIDDNVQMLEDIQTKCVALDIAFYGIHFIVPSRWH